MQYGAITPPDTQVETRESQPQQTVRVACIQNGDFKLARERMAAGLPESYFGMRESVRALDRLLARRAGLVLSLDAPPYRITQGQLQLVALAPPPRWLPSGRLRTELRARALIAELEAFAPTHVLLRVGGQIGLRIARWCARRSLPTLVVLANAVYGENAYMTRTNRALMQTLNAPCFVRVANYKAAACASMVDYGLTPEKVLGYAFDGERQPSAYPPKPSCEPDSCHIVFAGRMVAEKGPLELIEAVRRLHARGIPASATLFGDGPLLDEVRARARKLPPGAILTPGVVDNAALFQALRDATFACVPSRSTFVEGMPMALTEALAARTPVIASDCQVFARSFRDGEGVRLFREQDPESLAQVIAEAFLAPGAYAALSESTATAFARVAAAHSFSELLDAFSLELGARAQPQRA